MFYVHLDTDNADFEDKVAGVVAALRGLAVRLEAGAVEGKVLDANGNGSGYFALDASDAQPTPGLELAEALVRTYLACDECGDPLDTLASMVCSDCEAQA